MPAGLWIENSANLGVFSHSHMSRFLPIHSRSRIVVRQELDSSNLGAGSGVHYKVEEPVVRFSQIFPYALEEPDSN